MRRRLSVVLLIVGLAVLARPAGHRLKRSWYAWTALRMWSDCKTQPGSSGAGAPFAWLNIPDAGVDLMVLDGADAASLSRFPCRESVGQASLVMAHRDTHFQGLEKIREGDVFHWELRDGQVRNYQCWAIHIVDKAEVETLIEKQRGSDCLLLLTCYPFRYIGPAPQRFLVVATPR